MIVEYMKIPKEFESTVDTLFNEDEKSFIELIANKTLTRDEINKLLNSDNNNLTVDYLYNRGIIDIADKEKYKLGTYYTFIPYVSQYEYDLWKSLDKSIRNAIYQWQLVEYEKFVEEEVEKVLDGKDSSQDLYYMTLEETFDRIDKEKQDLFVQPCNCTTLDSNEERLRNVCIQIGMDYNYPNHRGYGEKISKEQAKDIVNKAHSSGLMQLGEHNAICNCDGKSCYPSNISKKLDLRKRWPKSSCDINFDNIKCINCNKCVRICNFNAFSSIDNIVCFNEENCYGCSICISHCPVNALSMK